VRWHGAEQDAVLMRSSRTRFEVTLFVLALVLVLVAGFGTSSEKAANTFYFAAWCSALLLLFSLGLRLPLHLRGGSAPLATAGIIGAAAGVGLLANIALYRHDVNFDLTETGRYTPPPELQTVASSLDRDVSLTYFYNGQDGNALQAKDTLAALGRRDQHLRVRALDLDNEPVAARNYGVRIYNTAVIEAEGRRIQVDNSTDLRDIAFGIERVLRERTPIVCFVTGHGEPYGAPGNHAHLGHTETLEGPVAVLDAPPAGIDRLTMAIEAIGYSDRAVALPAVSDIPADCAVVADLGPRGAYSPDEVRILEDYLARGGRLLLMYDPEFPVAPELQSMLGEVGVEVGSGMVVDPVNHSGTEADKVAVPYYPPHPITDQVALTVFPGPRPLTLLGKIPDIETTTLASTSQQSYVRPIATSAPPDSTAPDLSARGPTQPAVPPELKPAAGPAAGPGPEALAVALQGTWPKGEQNTGGEQPFRLVLVGNASFATNAFFPYASNGDLAVSMLRWLADDRATPKLKPATYSNVEVRLTHREMQLTFFLIEILLPLSVMAFGIAVWRRRR
jgi:ABC-2 type transport system permease protein